jgi:hypothetical protein
MVSSPATGSPKNGAAIAIQVHSNKREPNVIAHP